MIGANLGSDVQSRVDAYKDNPVALQQRYMKSQELVDLLALQKMKSEKDAYARDMQMKMNNNPNTIKQQLEAEMMGRTKDDVVRGVAGVLQNKQAEAQSNINKVANRGVAGQQAPNMLKLADGGIIGFAAGDQVPTSLSKLIKEKKAELKKQYDDGDINYSEYSAALEKLDAPAKIGPDSIARDVLGKDDIISSLVADQEYDDQSMGLGFGASKGEKIQLSPGPYTTALSNELQKKTPIGQLMKRNIKDRADEIGGPNIALKGSPALPIDDEFEDESYEPEKKQGIANVQLNQPEQKTNLSGIGAVKYEAPDYSKLTLNDPVKQGILSALKEDPQKAVDFQARTPTEQAMIDRLLKERMDLRADITDSDKLRTDALLSGLLAGPSATAGGAFRNLGRGILGAEQLQERVKRDELDAVNKMSLAEADKQQKIKGDAFSKAQDVKKSAVTSGASLLANEQLRVQGDAKSFFDADKANQTAAIKKAEIKSKEFVSQQNNKVRIDIANMEKGINEQKIKVQREANQIKKTQGEIDAARHILNNMETIINGAQKNITAAYDKQIKELDNPLGAGKGLEPAEIANKKAELEKQKQQAIADRVADLKIDADYARKIILGRVSTKSGKKTSNMDEVDKILGIK